VVPARFFTVSTALVAAIWLVVGLLGSVHALLYYRSWRFEIQDDALYLVRGRRHRGGNRRPLRPGPARRHPAGPVERLVGLSSLVVYTAGTRGADISIPGLTPERANRLRERLRDLAIESGGPTPYETAPPLSAVQRVIGTALQFGSTGFFLGILLSGPLGLAPFWVTFALGGAGALGGAVYGVARYLRFTYETAGDTLAVSSGVFNRQERAIPWADPERRRQPERVPAGARPRRRQLRDCRRRID